MGVPDVVDRAVARSVVDNGDSCAGIIERIETGKTVTKVSLAVVIENENRCAR
jgi:hypothetical protein